MSHGWTVVPLLPVLLAAACDLEVLDFGGSQADCTNDPPPTIRLLHPDGGRAEPTDPVPMPVGAYLELHTDPAPRSLNAGRGDMNLTGPFVAHPGDWLSIESTAAGIGSLEIENPCGSRAHVVLEAVVPADATIVPRLPEGLARDEIRLLPGALVVVDIQRRDAEGRPLAGWTLDDLVTPGLAFQTHGGIQYEFAVESSASVASVGAAGSSLSLPIAPPGSARRIELERYAITNDELLSCPLDCILGFPSPEPLGDSVVLESGERLFLGARLYDEEGKALQGEPLRIDGVDGDVIYNGPGGRLYPSSIEASIPGDVSVSITTGGLSRTLHVTVVDPAQP